MTARQHGEHCAGYELPRCPGYQRPPFRLPAGTRPLKGTLEGYGAPPKSSWTREAKTALNDQALAVPAGAWVRRNRGDQALPSTALPRQETCGLRGFMRRRCSTPVRWLRPPAGAMV